ncbi:hypothetical protein GBAR_LOCUS8598 [Geodia barretti]|nr:hypothetical protein GBAR_LOCUS8598 [Geodia barretti]
MAVSSQGLLVFTTLLLQVAVSVDDTGSCRTTNYQHGCREEVCQLSVSWRKETKDELSLRVSALALEDNWSTTISLSRASIEVQFTCQRRHGETAHNCSVGCLSANITYHDHHLDCRFTVDDKGTISDLISGPVSLLVSGANDSVGGAQWVSPGCLCDVRNCRDICDSCTTEAGGGGDKCHSILSLLLIRSHAILMVMTFLLLVPLGVAISRYSRPVFPYSWFRAHAAVNSATLVLILLGLGAVLGHTGGKFTAGLHQIAGIICITLLLLQALCGYLRPAAGVSLQ